MIFFICSDIHGSAYYCKMVIEKFRESGAKKLIILGDILYHGPRNDLPREYNPKAVIEMLNPLSDKILSVRGNCDTEVDQMVLNFPVLSDYGFLQLGEHFSYLTHGHHIDEIPFCDNDIVLSGHTHVPKAEKVNNYININPGSVSIPKENSPHSYIIFENNKFSFFDLETDEVYKTYEF